MMRERANEKIKGELQPSSELITEDGYRWFIFTEEQTALRMVCLEDLKTGAIVSIKLAEPNTRSEAYIAWGGARQSRAPGEPWEIMHEMVEKEVDPDQKAEAMFAGYGHASVGDMAYLSVDITRVPIHLAYSMFTEGATNNGQEKSTRYQKRFANVPVHPIENYMPEWLSIENMEEIKEAYERMGEMARAFFEQHKTAMQAAFTHFFHPSSKKEIDSLNSRALDCARFFALFGQSTGMAYGTSARDWAKMIGTLRASPLPFYQKMGDQIHRLLTPSAEEEFALGFKAGAPGLIRHADALTTTNINLQQLQTYIIESTTLFVDVPILDKPQGEVHQSVQRVPDKYSANERMVAQYVLTIYPGLAPAALLEWVHTQLASTKKDIAAIIYNGHNNYKELPQQARTTNESVLIKASLGEARDLIRHRALGRFVTLPTLTGLPIDKTILDQIIAKGWGIPLYLYEEPFKDQRLAFVEDMSRYYHDLHIFIDTMYKAYGDSIDYSFALNLLPMAHRVDLWLHGDPKQFLYMTHQRVKEGGHINYRELAYDVNQQIADADPYASAMRLPNRPNPLDRAEFFARN